MQKIRPSDEIRKYLVEKRNWGRWGEDDQSGTLNLVTPEKRLEALATVQTGEAHSLSRPLATWIGSGNPRPSQHFVKVAFSGGENAHPRPTTETPGGSATDFYGIPYHGVATTHLDAISHVWDENGMYAGKDPRTVVGFDGTTFGGIEQWSTGLITRGVLLDIPKLRGAQYVTEGDPVTTEDLERAAALQGTTISPGDAVCVYSGREKWQADNPDKPYGMYPTIVDSRQGKHLLHKPGLDASCVVFLREHDAGALVWDMLDATPYDDDVPYAVHGAIHAFGLAIVDNAVLELLAEVCAERGSYEFMLVVSPLLVVGGTGSPVNPLAIV